MQEWHGAVVVGADDSPLILLTDVYPTSGGEWVYVYSFRPGRAVSLVVRPGPGMLDPHDPYFSGLVRDIRAGYPGSAY